MASKRPSMEGTQSIERAVILLRALAGRGRFGWSLTELAAAAGITKTTAYRILSRLEHERLVHRGDRGDRYFIGFAIGELSLCIPGYHDFVTQAHSCALSTARKLSLVTIVYLRSGDHFVIASRIDSAHMRSRINEEGAYRPLISTAGGVAILMTLPEAEQKRVLAANVRELSMRGRTQLSDCHAMLERSRRLGVGTNFGDIGAGTNAIAVPFFGDGSQAIGSLAVAGPDSQLTEARCMELVPLLQLQAGLLEPMARELSLGPGARREAEG